MPVSSCAASNIIPTLIGGRLLRHCRAKRDEDGREPDIAEFFAIPAKSLKLEEKHG
jgi:hypothetical protein